MIGLSKYTVYSAKRKGWGTALWELGTTSNKMITTAGEIASGRPDKALDLIPVMGKPIRYWIGDDDKKSSTVSRGGRRGRIRRRRR